MKYVLASITLVISTLLIGNFTDGTSAIRKEPIKEMGVSEMLFGLGEPKPAHYLDSISEEMIARGKDLIFLGKTENPPEGERSTQISKYYKCISCHNTVKEDPDLTVVNPDIRLEYAKQNEIPYLQGSTFYGIVNRETWYNDDYVFKYGSLVEKAKNSLEGSVQLCAEVCAAGRTLKDWEIESILAYLWSIELNKSDLAWTAYDEKLMGDATDEERRNHIKKKYLLKSPATFGHLPISKADGYEGLKGNAEKGQAIYELGCQHCHREQGESDVVLDNSKTTFRWLKRNITANGDLSIYEIVRIGTYSSNGHQEYMPHYTEEKLSDLQLEDLRAYIELKSE